MNNVLLGRASLMSPSRPSGSLQKTTHSCWVRGGNVLYSVSHSTITHSCWMRGGNVLYSVSHSTITHSCWVREGGVQCVSLHYYPLMLGERGVMYCTVCLTPLLPTHVG